MVKYWMTRDGHLSQAGPYGEPPVESIVSETTGFAVEFTSSQARVYQTLLGLARAYRMLGGLDAAWDKELVQAEYVLEHYEDLIESDQ